MNNMIVLNLEADPVVKPVDGGGADDTRAAFAHLDVL
jgi:hypothetical protein